MLQLITEAIRNFNSLDTKRLSKIKKKLGCECGEGHKKTRRFITFIFVTHFQNL